MTQAEYMQTIDVSGYESLNQLQDYLPSNYWIDYARDDGTAVVRGFDRAGWTAAGYVVPRLQSGLIVATLRERD